MKKKSIDGNFKFFFTNICLGNPMNIKLPIDCNIAKADDLLLCTRPGLLLIEIPSW